MNVQEQKLEARIAELDAKLQHARDEQSLLEDSHQEVLREIARNLRAGYHPRTGSLPLIQAALQVTKQLDAANQRIDILKENIDTVFANFAEEKARAEAAERKLAEIAKYASGECLGPAPPESQDWESREEWTLEWIRRVATREQARGQVEAEQKRGCS